MAITQKNFRPDQVNLTKMNKYVGYQSQNLSVKLDKVTAKALLLVLKRDSYEISSY